MTFFVVLFCVILAIPATILGVLYLAHRHFRRVELIAHAEYEHRALLDGRTLIGVHGQYPPVR